MFDSFKIDDHKSANHQKREAELIDVQGNRNETKETYPIYVEIVHQRYPSGSMYKKFLRIFLTGTMRLSGLQNLSLST